MPLQRKIKLGDCRDELLNFFRKQTQILTVFIFGSHGTEYENKMSDIDFGILFENKISLMEELTIAGEIEMIVEKEIDLVTLNKANVILKYKIVKTGEIIFERNKIITSDFKENLLKEYFDFGYKLKKIKNGFHETLKEEYLDGGS